MSDKEFDKKYGPRRDFAFKVRYLVSEHPVLAYLCLCSIGIIGAVIDCAHRKEWGAPFATITAGALIFATALAGAIWAYVKDNNR